MSISTRIPEYDSKKFPFQDADVISPLRKQKSEIDEMIKSIPEYNDFCKLLCKIDMGNFSSLPRPIATSNTLIPLNDLTSIILRWLFGDMSYSMGITGCSEEKVDSHVCSMIYDAAGYIDLYFAVLNAMVTVFESANKIFEQSHSYREKSLIQSFFLKFIAELYVRHHLSQSNVCVVQGRILHSGISSQLKDTVLDHALTILKNCPNKIDLSDTFIFNSLDYTAIYTSLHNMVHAVTTGTELQSFKKEIARRIPKKVKFLTNEIINIINLPDYIDALIDDMKMEESNIDLATINNLLLKWYTLSNEQFLGEIPKRTVAKITGHSGLMSLVENEEKTGGGV